MEFFILLIAFVAAFVAMFVGALSGGIGFITRPILILLGVPIGTILGSGRVAGAIGETPVLYLLHKHKHIDWRLAFFLMVPMVLSNILVAFFVVALVQYFLNTLIGIFLLLAALVLFVNPHVGVHERPARFSPAVRHTIAFFGTLCITFFGVLTGGIGVLLSAFYSWLYGKSFASSAGLWRIAGYVGVVAGAIVFIVHGLVSWPLCIALALGFLLGSYYGTKYALRKGERWVRALVLVLLVAGGVKLLFFSS